MHTSALQEKPNPEPPDAASPDFDFALSRDLEAIEAATEHFRRAWRSLTPIAKRHAFAGGLVLETASMMGDLASERRKMEEAAQI